MISTLRSSEARQLLQLLEHTAKLISIIVGIGHEPTQKHELHLIYFIRSCYCQSHLCWRLCIFEARSHYIATTCLKFTLQTRLALNLERSSLTQPPTGRITGMYQRPELLPHFLILASIMGMQWFLTVAPICVYLIQI